MSLTYMSVAFHLHDRFVLRSSVDCVSAVLTLSE